ncbi:uncharacterized protein LOC130508213 [Raphanus sativus]|uniref:Uncharacterized protein LOC108843106 n=1 Tax=Raphanus sativus TaxID=3726 RepID=A0A6J0MGS0_RAPSA|nr:uncharacterized protein LOC108843106 [Raphanus sativus]XP_056859543.1 uncharacterized protein LOC130508213 [Raphanus sativus]
MERELDHMARFFEAAVAYKKKIGFNGTLLMRRESTDVEASYQWNGHSRSWTEKCSQDLGDLHKLEVLEKLEAKLKAEGKEEENEEGEGDDESEGHYLSQETALPFPHTHPLCTSSTAAKHLTPHKHII